jgi:FixJ family two-component response regulator
VVLPGTNGRQLAERLRQARPGLPVLYMSGHPDEALARASVPVGPGALDPGVSLLSKPFTIESLLRSVHEALRQGAG